VSEPIPSSERPARLVVSTLERLPSILTVDEVTKLLRLNRKTVYELVQQGRIPGAHHFGRVIRFSKVAVLEWLKAGGLAAAARAKR
jgi:excisionase family DNA binding protein